MLLLLHVHGNFYEKRLADVLLFFLKLPASSSHHRVVYFCFSAVSMAPAARGHFRSGKNHFYTAEKSFKAGGIFDRNNPVSQLSNTRWSCPSTVGRSDYSSPDQHVESLGYCLFPLLVPGQIKNSCQNGKKDTTTCAFLFEV